MLESDVITTRQNLFCQEFSVAGIHAKDPECAFLLVLRIRIRVSRIRMFLGLLDPDPDPLVRGRDPRIRIQIHTKMSWIRNTGSYLFLGGLRITGGVDMLPTHGALHHVPLGGVAVGPSTTRARQALQHRDVLSPGGRNFGQISILQVGKKLRIY
jgi:hypothetical protein